MDPNIDEKQPVQTDKNDEESKSEFKIWLDNFWYIPIDTMGQCIESYERSLGFNIRIKHGTTQESGSLKIPRLSTQQQEKL